MSELLDEIIADRKSNAITYEEYLKRIAALAKKVEDGVAEDTPEQLNTPGRRALFNNLSKLHGGASATGTAESYVPFGEAITKDPLVLVILIDDAVKQVRPDGWRGIQTRENIIKAELMRLLQDVAEVEKLFLIIKQQSEY